MTVPRRFMRCFTLLFVLVMLAVVFFTATPAMADGPPAKTEVTFSAALSNPKEGDTSWMATGELLVPLAGGPFLIGPSMSLFDTGPTDGGSFGVAGELNVGKTSGLFLGGALQKLVGDASDLAEYTGQVRAGFKGGGEHWFAKLFASQTWSREKDGAVTDPDGTSFQAGLGVRF